MSSFSLNSHQIDISTSNAPLPIKFALICLNKLKMPKWIVYFWFILSHIQVVAIIVKSAYIALPDNTPSVSPVIKMLLKFFIVEDWIDYSDSTPLLIGTSIITVYMLKMLGLVVYIHFSLALKWKIPKVIQYYWSTLHSLHPSLLFFWIHTFCVDITKYPTHYEVVHGIKLSLKIMAHFNTIINCTLALLFSMISLTYKNKDALSSKTSVLETKTVIFKIVIPALWTTAENNKGLQAFILILAFVNAIVHDWIFIEYLPYYQIKTLMLSSVLQAIQTSLALACCIVKFVEAGGANVGVFTFQMVWILLLPIAIRAYYNFTWKKVLHVFECDPKEEKNLYYLVHKRFILLYFLKNRNIIDQGIVRWLDADLMYQAKLKNIEEQSGLDFEELDRNKKLLMRSLKGTYLEILSKEPRSHLARINLANFYSKFENLYLVSNNLLEDAISKRPGYHAGISLNMLRFELQNKLMAMFSEKAGDDHINGGLNVYSYMINQELLDQLKINIGKQAEMQIDFWKEFLSRKPNMLNLMNIALKVNSQKHIVKRSWSNLSKVRAKFFLSPLVVYGKYSSLISNNPVEGEKFLERAKEDMKRLSKFFKGDELSNHTIFSDKSIKITMSGLRSKLGQIIDCSANIANFYGWQRSEIKDKPITLLMPPYYRKRHDSFLLDHFNTGKTKTLNTTGIVPVKRSNGYIHPTWIHVKVSPVMEQGIFYVGLLRPCKTNRRMIVVKKDGKIDDMSLGFAKDMNLEEGKEERNIFRLCPQFRPIHEAFNIIAEEAIEKQRPGSKVLLRTQGTRHVPKTEGNIGTITERNLTHADTDRPLISIARRNYTIHDSPEDEVVPTTLHDTTIERFPDKNNTQVLCENFMEGSTLTFHPVSSEDKRKSFRGGESITYSVKIVNNIHGNDVIKYIFLDRISGESDDEKGMSESSHHDAILPSVLNSELGESPKRRAPQVLSLFSPSRIGTTAPSVFETEGVELRTSPRIRIEETINNDDGTNMTISDEVQSNDSRDRRAVFRSILEEKEPPFSKKKENNGPELLKAKNDEPKKIRPLVLKPNVPLQPNLAIVSSVAHLQQQSMHSSSYLYKAKKNEQLMLQALRTEPIKKFAKIYTGLYILFFASVISLLCLQSANLSSGVDGVQSQVPVISAAFFRQYNLISGATQIRDVTGIIEGRAALWDWETDTSTFLTYLVEYVDDIHKYNGQFYQGLAKLPVEFQRSFHERNVGFYDYDWENGNKTLLAMTSVFEAIEVMIEKETRCLYMELPDQYEPDIDTSNHHFIMDNALNDLLVQSEDEITKLADYFDDSTNSTIDKTAIIMGCIGLSCLIFLAFSIRYLCLLASEARVFMTMIFRTKPSDCENTQRTIKRFQLWLNTDIKDKGIQNIQTFKNPTDHQNTDNSARFRKASMSSLYQSQRIAFFKLFPLYCLFICWSIIYYFMTSNFIGDIQDSKKRMEAALQALNNQTLWVNEMISIPLSNMSATIKNEPLRSNIAVTNEYLNDISVLVDWFRDRNGELTPLQQKVLFNFPCEDFVPYLKTNYIDYIYAYESCFAIGKGKDSIGLVNINTEFYNIALDIVALYDNSTKSADDLAYIFFLGVSEGNDFVNCAEGLLKMLYTVTYQSFQDEVDGLRKNSRALIVSIIVVTVAAIVLTWWFVIMRIFKIQKIDWYILQVIPIQLIRNNKHLQTYLLNHSDKMLYGVRRFAV